MFIYLAFFASCKCTVKSVELQASQSEGQPLSKRRNSPVREASLFCSMLAGSPENLEREVLHKARKPSSIGQSRLQKALLSPKSELTSSIVHFQAH